MKSMKQSAEKVVENTQNHNQQETIAPEALGLTGFVLPSGEYLGVKAYAVSFLPESVDEVTGKTLQATFGGLLESFTDPVTGEVRGTRGHRDSVPMSFFGATAEKWAGAILPLLEDPKRDSVFFGIRPEAEELAVIRKDDGRLKAVIASSRTFSGKVKVLVASPEVEFEVG